MNQENQRTISDEITETYAGVLLRWAVKKTGSRQDGEDLAQEVLLQVYRTIFRGTEIRQPEHFVWKVAHHCWCNYLRKTRIAREIMPLDESIREDTSVIDEFIEDEHLRSEISLMRRKIADLSRNQREAMLLYYLDGLSVRQVAEKLSITESAVKKHLFEARKKVKREMGEMKSDNEFVYRPGKLVLGVSGILPEEPDTAKVNDNLVRQNLLLLCSREARNLDELAERTGIPKPYLEPELDWLTAREFLSFEAKKYSTIIPVIDKKHSQDRGDIYINGSGRELIDAVLSGLIKKENEIRDIGFYGSGFETGKLLWPVLMLFISYFSRNNETAVRMKHWDEREIRPDGGKYYVIGNDHSEEQDIDPSGYFKPEGWGDFRGIISDSCASEGDSDSYYWLGLYTFAAKEYEPDIVAEDNIQVKKAWHRLYCNLVEPGFTVDRLDDDRKEMLSEAVACGYVLKTGDDYTPRFVILTSGQLRKFQEDIFKPLLEEIEPKLKELAGVFHGIHRKNLPKITRNYADFLTYLDLWNFGPYAYIVAVEEGLLSLPATPEEGACSTLVLVK